MSAPSPPPAQAPEADPRTVLAWASYDAANTVYYAVVVTATMPSLYADLHGALAPVGVTTSLTLLASAFVSPQLGAWADRTGRARPGLDIFTNLCCAFTALLFFAAPLGPAPLLACYALSLFCYQGAITFYNALLPVVAPPHRRGYASGLGTGLGYAATPVAILLGIPIAASALGVPGKFLLSAVVMTIGTVPLWLRVKDGPTLGDRPAAAPPAGGRGGGLAGTVRLLREHPALALLLLANFVSADVANTLIQYAVVYFEQAARLSKTASNLMLVALAVVALVGGLLVGRVADRWRPTRLYAAACAALVAGLVLAALLPGSWPATAALVLTGGVGVSTIWSVGRQLVLRVAPPGRFGEALGLYGVTTKASIVGTSLFGVIVDASGYPLAILLEAAALAFGVVLVVALGRRLAREGRGG